MSTTSYPKRLIEVDLPIARISAHARREKSIRHGHISTLHIWWARRPLAACRAVICAALWPDPVDLSGWLEKGEEVPAGDSVVRPVRFLDTAQKCMIDWGKRHLSKVSPKSYSTFIKVQHGATTFDDPAELRRALLDFIADFANWDNSTDKDYLETARKLTQAAHEALGGDKGTRPLVVDPFAGGGSIPLEALRVGADAFASDLNPIAVLLNVVVEALEIGDHTISDYLLAANNVKERLDVLWDRKSFVKFWSRTIHCEGLSCGVEIPLIRSGQISRRGGFTFEFVSSKDGRVEIEKSATSPKEIRPMLRVVSGGSVYPAQTCRNGSVTCPVCNFTHKQSQIARQALRRGFGDRLIAIGEVVNDSKSYRSPSIEEERAKVAMTRNEDNIVADFPSVPINPERPSPAARGMSAVTRYGYAEYRQLFSPRQLRLLETVRQAMDAELATLNSPTAPAVRILLAITFDRLAAFQNTFCRWAPKGEHPVPPFGKNGFPMIWDYVEASPFGDSAGSWDGASDWVRRVLEHLAASRPHTGSVEHSDSQIQILPNDAADAWITDPPYYDSYPYADLSDFFYPLLRASLSTSKHPVSRLFQDQMTPKDQELVLQPTRTSRRLALRITKPIVRV